MKKLLLSLCLLPAAFTAFAQQLTVAVEPFEVRGNISRSDADTVYELFVGELAVSGSVKVVDRNSFDKIRGQMKFEMSDWSDSNKVAQFGRALNANSIIRGQITPLEGKIVIITRIIDINTAQILSSSRLQVNSIGEVFDKIPAFVQDMVKHLPASGLKIGDRGPGGGIVFFAEGGSYMEVSPMLGSFNWNDAMSAAGNYRGGGFTNWHLPTEGELEMIFQNLGRKNIGGMGNDTYWSSSQAGNDRSVIWSFRTDYRDYGNKNSTYSVRAVRAF
jgi:TolB-like protein